jgi:hypothetical protein
MNAWQDGAFFQPEFIGTNSWNGYEHDNLCRNDDNGRIFTDIGHVSGIDLESDARGMTYLDFDLDGDQDVIVVAHRQKATFLRNDFGQKSNWLQVGLVGTQSNRQGVGARVTIRAGNRQQMREVRAGGGFLQGNSVPESFGLGRAVQVDELTVRWPSGTVQTFKNIPANQVLKITESGPELSAKPSSGKTQSIAH